MHGQLHILYAAVCHKAGDQLDQETGLSNARTFQLFHHNSCHVGHGSRKMPIKD
jgi:hypothetical protein